MKKEFKVPYDYKNLAYNIDKYMDKNSIENYAVLLRKIAQELGKKGNEIYKFVENERSNFSKMMTGKRPLKYEFIIPLEKVFGVTLAKLLYDDRYDVQVEKENVPYPKSFRYYAYMDDPKLYSELESLTDTNGRPIILTSDEYGKFFLDYVHEYNAINALKYLSVHRKLRTDKFGREEFVIDDDDANWLFVSNRNHIEIAKMIIRSGDAKMFLKTFNDLDNLALYPWSQENGWFNRDDFAYEVLENKDIFGAMFIEKDYEIKKLNNHLASNPPMKNAHYCNLFLNILLEKALKHPDKYKQQIMQIIKYGIQFNKKTDESVKDKFEHFYSRYRWILYGDNLACGSLIVKPVERVGDAEIDALLKELPMVAQW